MGRRAWGWKAVGDRAGSAQESLQLHPRGSVKAEKKKRRVYNCQNLFLSPFLFLVLSPKVLPMPWVAVPTLCARLPAKLRKSLPQ
jgi:hypothetical protein